MNSSLEKIIDEFNKLPGIGRKSAQRIAFHLLSLSDEEVAQFSETIKESKSKIRKCNICGNLSEGEICDICSDEYRDNSIVCVVEDCRDIISLEKTGKFKGKYHVLGGKIAPLKGVTPDKLNLESLLHRIAKNEIKEVIIAINPDLEGETTALYLTKILKNFNIKITKIASGIPMGGNIEYADSATIARALEGRLEL